MSQGDENLIKESEELFSTQDLLNVTERNTETPEITEPMTEDQQPETPETEENPANDDEVDDEVDEVDEDDKENADEPTSENVTEKSAKPVKKSANDRLTELPLSKIKNIIKLDPEVQLVSSKLNDHIVNKLFNSILSHILDEAVFLITRATENFIKSLSKESATLALQQKKKTVLKSHVDFALTMLPIELWNFHQ